jgi:uncharacterized C2H2 Zn-finger protein
MKTEKRKSRCGTALWRCNHCGSVMLRDYGWKMWTPGFCDKVNKKVRLYRITAPRKVKTE